MTEWEQQRPTNSHDNSNQKKQRTRFLICLIVIVNVFIFFSIAIVILDIPFPVINPHKAPVPLRFNLSYPPPEGVVSQYPDVYVQVTLQSNETIAEGTPVLMSAVGSLSKRDANNVTQVEVGFVGAEPDYVIPNSKDVVELYTIGPSVGSVILTPYHGNQNHTKSDFGMGGPDLVGDSHVIQWDVQGDYSPTLLILFNSPTNVTQQNNPEIRVHVSPASVLEDERLGRENIVISLALVGFEFGASIMIIRELVKSTQSRTNGSKTSENSIKEGDTNTE